MVSSTKKAAKPALKSAEKTPAKTPAKTPGKASQVVKRPVSAKATASAKTAGTKPATPSGTAEPFLRFYLSKELRAKTHAVLTALEAQPDQAKHGDAMADLVAQLTEAGMDYYYMKALKLAKVGFVGEQSARLGMSGAVMLINSVSRKFIVSMDKDQLLIIARHIRDLA